MYESEATSVKLKCFTVLEIGAGGLIITQQPLSLQKCTSHHSQAGEQSNVLALKKSGLTQPFAGKP